MLTPLQKQTAQAIVNLFETSSVRGDYGAVTVIAGDTGHLSFGRSQTTLGSGNLHALLQRYCDNAGARFGPRLAPWLQRVEQRDTTLDHELRLHNLLRATADDPVMREMQDQFFDEGYWQPAARIAAAMGIATPLGLAVVYDSLIQGSWKTVRDLTITRTGRLAELGERAWIGAYIATRHAWLAGLDAVFEKSLAARESTLLANVPILLGKCYEQRYTEHRAALADEDDPATWTQPGSWLEAFCNDAKRLLLAELDLRLKLVSGLIAALASA